MKRYGGALLVIIFLTVMGIHAWRSAYDHDEVEHLHAAWLISEGERPYVDFLEQHNPTLWYVIAPLVKAWEGNFHIIFIMRMLDAIALGAALLFMFFLLSDFFPHPVGSWMILVLTSSFTFVRNFLEVRPDPWMTMLFLLSLLLWLRAMRRCSLVLMAFSGGVLGLAGIVLQKALIFLPLFTVIFCAGFIAATFFRLSRGFVMRAFATFMGGAAFPLALFALVIWKSGFGREYFFWNFTFNRFFYLEAHLADHFSWLVTFSRSLAHNFLIWLIGLVGLGIALKEHIRDYRLMAVVFLLVSLFISFTQSGFPLAQYLLPILPLLCIVGGCVWDPLKGWPNLTKVLKMGIILMMVECCTLLLCYPTNMTEREAMETLLAKTAPDERVFVEPPHHPIFRRDANFVWYNRAMIFQALKEYERRTGKTIEGFVSDHQ